MLKLESICKDATVNGIVPNQVVRVVTTEPVGDNALTVYYRTPDGQLAEPVSYTHLDVYKRQPLYRST